MQPLRNLASLAGAAALLLSAAAAPASPLPPDGPRPEIDVVFVLDTTGSMSGLIEGAKQKIWSIANAIAAAKGEPRVRFGLVGYRDRGDAYVTRRVPLTDDIDSVYAELRAFRAGGGGDTPESVNQALHEAVTQMAWRDGEGVYRVVFLVGDAPPHLDYQDDVPWVDSLALAAKRGIVVNAVQCGAYAETTPIWREIARRGEGEYAQIDQSGGMVAIATPVDEELAELNVALAGTAVPWGSDEDQAALARKLESAARAPASVAAERLGYLDKAGGKLAGGRADLVEAAEAGEVDPASVPEPELPREMHGLDDDAKRAYVARKQEERETLRQRIASLVAKRDAFVRKEQERLAREGRGDGFDARVTSAIRKQAAEKGILYE